MFGLGFWEIVLIAVVALLVLGPRRLPEVARQIGLMIRELRRASNELRTNIDEVSGEVRSMRPDTRDLELRPPSGPIATALGTGDAQRPSAVSSEQAAPSPEPVRTPSRAPDPYDERD